MPCYDEEATLASIVGVVLAADRCGLELELIIVDDASSDQSVAVADKLVAEHAEVKMLRHEENQGKGAALRTGFAAASGDIVLVQDADMEYSPDEYPSLLRPILDGRADVVYGSRFRGGMAVRVLYFWHSLANRCLTLVSNIFTDFNLTDMETCYKVFRRDTLERLHLVESRFGIEPEITAKLSKLNPRPRIYEVGISYTGRTYEEGKKIGLKDAFRAIFCVVRYNLFP